MIFTKRGGVSTHRTMALGQTKGVDVLVTNPGVNKLYKVEVKTTQLKLKKEKLFGDGYHFSWAMSAKHENMILFAQSDFGGVAR